MTHKGAAHPQFLTRMPLAYVAENVPGAARYRSIIDAFSLPLKVQAQHRGYAARRDTLLWTNAKTLDHLRARLNASLTTPIKVKDVLDLYWFSYR